MKYTKTDEISTSILLEEGNIRRLERFLIKNFSQISYSGELSDGTDVIFETIDELLEYVNPDKRRIIRLAIDSSDSKFSYDDTKRLNVVFRNYRGIIKPKAVRYTLKYEDRQWGFSFEDEFQDEIKQLAPSYNALTYFDANTAVAILWVAYAIISAFYRFYNKQVASLKAIHETSWLEIIIFGFIFSIPYLFIIYWVRRFKDYVFPVFLVGLGNQVQSASNRRFIANILFLTISASIILGLIVNFIYDKIK